MGEHLLCKQGVVGSIPISSTTTGDRGQGSGNGSDLARLSIARHDNVQLWASATECKAESCRSLTIREGKAFMGFDENPVDEGLSCILPAHANTKGVWAGGANTLVNMRSLGDGEGARRFLSVLCSLTSVFLKGPRLWGQATKCM